MRVASPPSLRPVRLIEEDPELYEALRPEHRGRALQICLASALMVSAGRWDPAHVEPASIGLLVLDGLLLRQVGIDGRFGAELVGAGDLLRPWQLPEQDGSMACTAKWRCVETAQLAALTPPAAARLAQFPELIGPFAAKALRRSRRLALLMAIVHNPRIEARLQMLFWHLADQWGRVRADGVFVPFRLSHGVLGDLIAAQRPSVTGALNALRRRGLIHSTDDGWLLLGDPPGELLELQPISLA